MSTLDERARTMQRTPTQEGRIYLDWTEDAETPYARRALVMEGPSSLTAYVGVPLGSPLANRDYDDVPLDVHGGLTFGRTGDDETRYPAGWYWYGWDYAHLGDISKFDRKYNLVGVGDHEWTIPEVYVHAKAAMHELHHLLLLEVTEDDQEACMALACGVCHHPFGDHFTTNDGRYSGCCADTQMMDFCQCEGFAAKES